MDTEQPNPQTPLPASPPPPDDATEAEASVPASAPPLQSTPPATPAEEEKDSMANAQNPTIAQPASGDSDTAAKSSDPPQSDIQQPQPESSSLETVTHPEVVSPLPGQVVGAQMSAPVQASGGGKLHLSGAFGDRRKLALLVLALLFAFVSAVAVYYVLAHRDSQKKIASLEKEIATLSADTHDLPEGAIQASECIPNMGFHYIDPESDPRFGPYYLVNKQGKVIGLEYMFNNSMLTSIPAGIVLEVLLTDGPISLHGWQFETIEFARSPSGHPGFTEDHVDVHLYTVTPEEQKKSCE